MINEYLADFEGWIEVLRKSDELDELAANYDFDRTIVETGDYIYIDSEERTWEDGHTTLVNYDVYFFDIQSQVLYYFHSNI